MIVLTSIFSWLVSVLVNALSDSLPYSRRAHMPRCLACGAPRPLPSWSALVALALTRTNCEYCGTRLRLRLRHAIVEIAGLTGGALLWVWSDGGMQFAGAFIVCAVFLLITVIDVEQRLILHVVTMPAAAVFLVIGVLTPSLGWRRTLIGGAAGFITFFLLYLLGGLFARWAAARRGDPQDEIALGFGDVTLATLIGLAVGFPAVIEALIRGVLYGGVFSGVMILVMLARKRYRAYTPIPYGPFLILGALWVYFQGWTTLEKLLGL